MIKDVKFSTKKFRGERSNDLGVAIDVSDSIITVVYYDFQLKRIYAMATIAGGVNNTINVMEHLTHLVVSSMGRFGIMASDVTAVGIAASFMVSCALEEKLTVGDLYLRPETEIYYMPFISMAIGGRNTAALLSVTSNNCLIADIGKTLFITEKKDNIYRCASFELAGAFDGSGYESGMPPVDGAIDYVRVENDDTLVYEVIGDCDSVGISPCGVAASISVMLDKGAIDGDGIMLDRDLFAIGEDFFVTQNDVRVFQTDKARVATAMELFPDADKLYASSGLFTTRNSMRLAGELGIIPGRLTTSFCLNLTINGIIRCLQDEKTREEAEKIAKSSLDITSELTEKFSENYFEHLILEKKCKN